MAIDERLEFLLRSTGSLHATAALQSERLDKESYRVDKQSERLDKVIHAMELMEHKFSELAATMREIAVATLNHERRIGKLDAAPDQA